METRLFSDKGAVWWVKTLGRMGYPKAVVHITDGAFGVLLDDQTLENINESFLLRMIACNKKVNLPKIAWRIACFGKCIEIFA